MAANPNHHSTWVAEAGTLLETVPMPVSRVAMDGTILWANRAELRLLGYAEDEYVGHHVAEFHADVSACAALLARIRCGESFANHEVVLRARRGEPKQVLMTVQVRWSDDGA